MELKQLLDGIEYTCLSGDIANCEISRLCYDNRQVGPGDLFICIRGAKFDPHNCVEEIIEKGAAAVVVERSPEASRQQIGGASSRGDGVPVILVEDTRAAEGMIAAAYFGHPADRMTTIGVTGSKGKTTTAHMLADILRADGHRVGSIGTNGAVFGDREIELDNTTPSAHEIQMYLAQMADEGIDTAVIECSSQGLMQKRTGGFTFDCGIFLNIAEGDHIGVNEHRDFAEYLYSKSLLIRQSRLGIVNIDDPHTADLLEGVDTPVVFFGEDTSADYYVNSIEKTFDDGQPGLWFTVGGRFDNMRLHLNMPGEFNAMNALAAVSAANEMGAGEEAMRKALDHMEIKGRFDIVFKNDRFTVCVDFAHNGYSTRNHLQALREYRPGRIVCVFGADGNRSKSRRYEMGEASGRLADLSIVTSGHNRWETFDEILKDIKVGLDKTDGEYIVIPDRKEAIRYAMENAEEGDMITILGLGHESYQEENGVKSPYSDREWVLEVADELQLTGEKRKL